MIIGLTLAGNALSDAIPAATEGATTETVAWTVVALVTLLSTILYARYLKGFLGQLPLLLGVVTGSVVAGLFYAGGINLFREVPAAALGRPPCGSWGTALSSRCPPSPCPRSPGRLWRPLCPLPSPPFPSPPPTCTSWTSTSTMWPGKRQQEEV